MTQKDNQNISIPPNYEALLKEYELKFNYISGLSSRVLTLVSAHIVFLGASLVVFFGEKMGTYHRYSVAAFNFIFCCLCVLWIYGLGQRHQSNRNRINEIAGMLGIRGYHQHTQSKLVIPKSPFAFTKSWFVIVALFWVIYCLVIE